MTVFQPPAYATIGADAGYSTLAAAVATISTTDCTLILPSGAHVPPGTIPANIQLQFAKGAYLDTTGFLAPTAPESMETYNTTDIKVKVTGHGLATGDRVCFYGVVQADWYLITNTHYVVTRIDPDYFNLNAGWNVSGFAAYVPASNPDAKVFQFTALSGHITDTMEKIFNVDSPAIGFGVFPTGNDRYYPKTINMRPEWWGAKGDYGAASPTDNINAFNYMLLSTCLLSRERPPSQRMLLDGLYYLSDTWSFSAESTNSIGGDFFYTLQIQGVTRERSGIVSGSAGYPAIEFGAWGTTYLNDLMIRGINNSGYPTVGIYLSRVGTGTSTGASNNLRVSRIRFEGTFQYGCICNRNCESNDFDDLFPNNQVTQEYNFVYAGLGGPSVMSYLPNIVPKYFTYAPGTEATDSCSFNAINRTWGSQQGTVPDHGCMLYMAGWADVNVTEFYWGLQNAVSSVVTTVDNATIYLRSGAIERVPGAGGTVYNCLLQEEASAYVTIREELTCGMGQTTSGVYYLLSEDANVTIRNCKFGNASSIKVVGDFLGNEVIMGAGNLELSAAVRYNKIYLGNSVGMVNVPVWNSNYFGTDNQITDDRLWIHTAPGALDTRFNISTGILTLGTETAKGSGDGGLYAALQLGGILGPTIDYGPNVPTIGSFLRGSVRFNTAADATGDVPAWMCITSGSYGSLSGITGTTDGTRTVVVNDLTGLYIGLFITIADVGSYRIVDVDAVSSTKKIILNTTASAASGKGISVTNAPEWRAFAVLTALP